MKREIEHHKFISPLDEEPDKVATVTPERIIINLVEWAGKRVGVRVTKVEQCLVIERLAQ